MWDSSDLISAGEGYAGLIHGGMTRCLLAVLFGMQGTGAAVHCPHAHRI